MGDDVEAQSLSILCGHAIANKLNEYRPALRACC